MVSDEQQHFVAMSEPQSQTQNAVADDWPLRSATSVGTWKEIAMVTQVGETNSSRAETSDLSMAAAAVSYNHPTMHHLSQ